MKPALIFGKTMGFTTKFEPTHVGCYDEKEFSDTLWDGFWQNLDPLL
jgi:hypothetical protein